MIEADKGIEGVRAMLRGYRDGYDTPQVLHRVLGLTPEAFDMRFDGYVRKRFAAAMAAIEPGDGKRPVSGAFTDAVKRGTALLQADLGDSARAELLRAEALFPEYARRQMDRPGSSPATIRGRAISMRQPPSWRRSRHNRRPQRNRTSSRRRSDCRSETPRERSRRWTASPGSRRTMYRCTDVSPNLRIRPEPSHAPCRSEGQSSPLPPRIGSRPEYQLARAAAARLATRQAHVTRFCRCSNRRPASKRRRHFSSKSRADHRPPPDHRTGEDFAVTLTSSPSPT